MSPGSSAAPYFRSRRRGRPGEESNVDVLGPTEIRGEKTRMKMKMSSACGEAGNYIRGRGGVGVGKGEYEKRRSLEAPLWRKTTEEDMSRDIYDEPMR